jgi:hypothetical protein
MRSFRQIMRDIIEHRQAGLSIAVAVNSALDDAEWQIIFDKLIWVARLEKALAKYKPGQR